MRALGSPGVTRIRRYYDPLRGPSQPPPFGCVPRRLRASSPDTDHLLDVLCSIPRWIGDWYFSVVCAAPRAGCFPVSALAFPDLVPVGIHGSTFRGLLKLHSRYGPSICSPTLGGLGRKASTPPVPRRRRFSATQAYRYPPEAGLAPAGVPRCKSARQVHFARTGAACRVIRPCTRARWASAFFRRRVALFSRVPLFSMTCWVRFARSGAAGGFLCRRARALWAGELDSYSSGTLGLEDGAAVAARVRFPGLFIGFNNFLVAYRKRGRDGSSLGAW